MKDSTKAVESWVLGKQRNEEVYFRKYPDGDIIAIFPRIKGSYLMYGGVWAGVMSYMHIGQHGAANETIVLQSTVPAKPSEYAPLLKELKRFGYRDLKITLGPP